MKNLISLLIITVTLISCSVKKESKEVSLTFDLYGTSELVFFNKSTDSVRVELSNYPVIIGGAQEFVAI